MYVHVVYYVCGQHLSRCGCITFLFNTQRLIEKSHTRVMYLDVTVRHAHRVGTIYYFFQLFMYVEEQSFRINTVQDQIIRRRLAGLWLVSLLFMWVAQASE